MHEAMCDNDFILNGLLKPKVAIATLLTYKLHWTCLI